RRIRHQTTQRCPASGLREHFYWQKSRKPEAGQR
ncbi:DUF2554 family protein, partial [Shigella sonnei]